MADNSPVSCKKRLPSQDRCVSCSVEEQKQGASSTPSFWGVAASLADTVKKNTAEITAGLKDTNWRAELEAFSKGVQEEEHLLRKETAKRVEVARERFPKDASTLARNTRFSLSWVNLGRSAS